MKTQERTRQKSGRTYDPAIVKMRNIGIVAHVDAGKTTLTERVLFYTGAIHQVGDVNAGNTTTDFDPIEQRKGITINAAAISCTWIRTPEPGSAPDLPYQISIIDTPGHVDFTAEVERTMRVLDGVIAVFSGVDGVQPQSERVWRQAERYGVPRLAFINKMDRTGADFDAALQDLREKLQANAAAILLPLGSEDGLRGQLDVLNQRAILFDEPDGSRYRYAPVPAEEQARVEAARQDLVDRLIDLDEDLAEVYLLDGTLTADQLRQAIRRQTLARAFVPVAAGSAFKNLGVQPLLDAVVDYLPSPLDVTPAPGRHPETEESIAVRSAPDAPLRALVFKIASDEYSRRRAFVRVYSGRLVSGDVVLNATTGKTLRLSRLVKLQADQERRIDSAEAGEIVALVGAKGVVTGHTLCALDSPVLLEPPTFPDPVISMAIEPKTREDRERLGFALQQLAEEDPTFQVTVNPETGQTLIAGMGELHLAVLRERMSENYRVETTAGEPRIAYRETATQAARGEEKYVHQRGGPGMYGHVVLELRPAERGTGVVIQDRTIGGSIPRHFIGACQKGIHEALANGVLAGYPIVDVAIDIVDGSIHEQDSTERAFAIAASRALKDAMGRAGAVLLEPIMRVECITPPEHQGDLVGDLTRRRGQVLNMRARGLTSIIESLVPLVRMSGYATVIRTLSKGRAEFSMEPSHFEEVPAALAAKVVGSHS